MTLPPDRTNAVRATAAHSVVGMVHAAWHYRGFIGASVRREFEVRYKASLLGAAWALLHPLTQILIYTVVLAGVMKARMPGIDTTYGYSIYLTAGVVAWSLFAEILSRSTSVFVDNANLLKKLSFPRVCLSAVVVLSALVNFAILFVLLLGVLLVTGALPGWPLLGLVPVVLIEVALATGLGLVAGVANVFYRDVGQALGVVLPFWFWLTPIVYPPSIVPDAFRTVIDVNPVAPLARAFQDVLVFGRWPSWDALLWPALFALAVAAVALAVVRRAGSDIVDEL